MDQVKKMRYQVRYVGLMWSLFLTKHLVSFEWYMGRLRILLVTQFECKGDILLKKVARFVYVCLVHTTTFHFSSIISLNMVFSVTNSIYLIQY
jgi:hypothetical protein